MFIFKPGGGGCILFGFGSGVSGGRWMDFLPEQLSISCVILFTTIVWSGFSVKWKWCGTPIWEIISGGNIFESMYPFFTTMSSQFMFNIYVITSLKNMTSAVPVVSVMDAFMQYLYGSYKNCYSISSYYMYEFL